MLILTYVLAAHVPMPVSPFVAYQMLYELLAECGMLWGFIAYYEVCRYRLIGRHFAR